MVRPLTTNEQTRLAARHVDSDAWWVHAQAHFGDDAEAYLVVQLAAADAVIADLGEGYVPYADRLAAETP